MQIPSYYSKEDKALYPKLYRWMQKALQEDNTDHWDVNTTQLAEDCAHAFEHDDWLDDDTHIVWDAAVAVTEWWEGLDNDNQD